MKNCCNPEKTDQTPTSEEMWVVTGFKALGHPVRLGIIRILGEAEGAVCACDIECRFELSQPTISHHLRILREAGLVTTEQRGTWIHYSLATAALARLRRWLKTTKQEVTI